MSPPTIHVLGISGSLRKGSYNTALLHEAAELAPEGMKVEVYPIGDLPIFNADLETAGSPAPVDRLRDAVANADGLLLATPEYNWSTTAALKNAIDWVSRGGRESPLNFKPAAILGAGGRFGTLRAQLHLRQILGHNQVRLVASPEVMIARASQSFDEGGRLVDDRYRDQVGRLLHALDDLISGPSPEVQGA